jgi:hypothetical protein
MSRQPRIAKDIPAHTKKPQPWVRSRGHLAFVGSLPCLACGRPGPNEAAHVRSSTDGAAGRKPSDRYTVPLCERCHLTGPRAQHTIGELTFWAECMGRGISDPLGIAESLWKVSGDAELGYRAIQHARPGLPTA